MFYSLTNFSVQCDAQDLVHLDIYHPSFVTELNLPLKRTNLSCSISFGRRFSRDYLVLYNTLSAYDWSSRCNETSADSWLTVALSQVTETDVPTGCSKICKYPVWFCDDLNFYIRKKYYFYSCFETFKSIYFPYTLVQGWPSSSHRKAT